MSLLCDETTGCGHHEKIFVVVTYFCSYVKNGPVALFTALARLRNLESNSVLSRLQAVPIGIYVSWHSVNSVCFDEASAMSGHISAVKIRANSTTTNSCTSTATLCLNLALVDGCP